MDHKISENVYVVFSVDGWEYYLENRDLDNWVSSAQGWWTKDAAINAYHSGGIRWINSNNKAVRDE